MKKSLIALAALAATASFAQSSVTLSGVLDFAVGNVSGNSKGTTVSTRDVTSATSVIRITAVEDLGGGMKATAHYGIDPRHLANDAQPFGRDELFVGLSGGFGNIRLGSPNSIGLTTFLSASPLGTGIGSGYAAAALDYSFIRHNRSVRYDSPNMNGFAVAVGYTPGGDDAALASFIPAASEVTEVGVTYANGPLSLAYANIAQGTRTNPTAAAKTSTNILAARYTVGATTLSAGWNDGDASARAAVATKTEGYRLGVAHAMGAVTLLASYAEQKTPLVKEKITGLRADYALSKRTAAYLGYEDYDNGAATNASRKITAVGVRHSF